MLNDELFRKINSGRCFALVGAGPSVEVGYPSWRQLAERTFEAVRERGAVSDARSYEKYLAQGKFAEMFDLAQGDLGGRGALIEVVKVATVPRVRRPGFLYDYLVKWPFACYMTTNYDNELAERLSAKGVPFTTLRNRKEDFYPLRDGATGLVVKLHSDLDHPDEAVLTSEDYQRLEATPEGSYFRDRLRSVFENFFIFIIGHSLNDPDLAYILKLAKATANPSHPIYVAMADLTVAEQSEYRRKYNIVASSYANPDGEHSQLRRMFRVADKFIAPRSHFVAGSGPPQPREELEAASALLIYRRLHALEQAEQNVPGQLFEPVVLATLGTATRPMTSREIAASPPMSGLVTGDLGREAVRDALPVLVRHGLVLEERDQTGYRIAPAGSDRIAEIRAIRELEETRAFSAFLAQLRHRMPTVTAEDEGTCVDQARRALVNVFRSRGLTIASAIYSDRSVDPADFADIFVALSAAAQDIRDGELRACFLECARDFVVEPTPEQASYLEAISQGYFLYHMVGHDPNGTRIRRELLGETAWFLDSSVLLPWVAVGCHSHEYATDLFERLGALNATLVTTDRLLHETWEHLQWAVRLAATERPSALGFLSVATVKDEFKQNLFVDGYIRLSAEGAVGTFEEYLRGVCSNGLSRAHLDREIERRGVKVLAVDEMEGFSSEDWGDLPELENKIQRAREARGTFRHESQVKAEAEVLHLVRSLRKGKYRIRGAQASPVRTYFASQGRILDTLHDDASAITWSPEALYRYVTALPGEVSDAELLQKCMLSEYYFSGVSFIDKRRYEVFFGPAIREARVTYAEQRDRYLQEVEADAARCAQFDEAFESTPDLQKPFFVSQMTTHLAELANERARVEGVRARVAEARVSQLEAERASGWKRKADERERQEAARLRQAADPKHRRKKERQAKKRRRKK